VEASGKEVIHIDVWSLHFHLFVLKYFLLHDDYVCTALNRDYILQIVNTEFPILVALYLKGESILCTDCSV